MDPVSDARYRSAGQALSTGDSSVMGEDWSGPARLVGGASLTVRSSCFLMPIEAKSPFGKGTKLTQPSLSILAPPKNRRVDWVKESATWDLE